MRVRLAIVLAVLALVPLAALAWAKDPPADYGRVTLDLSSSRAGMAPVQFDHWSHRARFTCRVCHVDVGFAMTAEATRISASTNRGGSHCGACHDGKTLHKGSPIFASCGDRGAGPVPERCSRCHVRDDPAARNARFEAFAANLPRRRSGAVDWEKAEAIGAVRPIDRLDARSNARPALRRDVDVVITSRGWMTDVLFSHRKHAVWNGCEVCHPEIFAIRQGEVRYTMLEINAGESCGACHGKVAFAIGECERCHLGPRSAPMR